MGIIGLIFLVIAGAITFFSFRDKSRAKRLGEEPELPSFLSRIVVPVAAVLGVVMMLFTSVFFYAEPGYIYHVRTIFGQEKVVSDVGYNAYTFGRINEWKRAVTVQAVRGADTDGDGVPDVQSDSHASASMAPLNVIFLDQVDGDTEATARFSLPTDREAFLKMAHEYRNPENLLRTTLVPAFKTTLHATGSLLSAEAYFSGGRTEFNAEFQNQLQNGIYLVNRTERRVKDETAGAKGSANASSGKDQKAFGDDSKVVFEVKKRLDKTGQPLREPQTFTKFGVTLVDARVTDMIPNPKFKERMQLKQKASADRAIAREQRVQEEEQRLLAIAKGEREVAQRQAKAKVSQIEQTTNAETTKQLALTKANQQKEAAAIERETSEIKLAKAQIDAKAKKVTADATAYEKKAVILADNALAQKLAAEIEIQGLWAEAFKGRSTPTNVFGAGNGTPTGSDSDTAAFMQMLTLDMAKRLSYDREVDTTTATVRR